MDAFPGNPAASGKPVDEDRTSSGDPGPMDTAKTPLLANLDRALRKAYTGAGASAEPPRPEADAPVPETIGRYRVRGVIARGGMGAVLRAEDLELGRDVAVKVSRSHDPALLALFANEARICSQLQHPGIVPVYERGRTEDGRPYYVMKLIEGETLATLLGARASLADDAARMLEIFTAVCQTMAYVHARGVFHGDLKPGNVMVGAFGEVQVMDWGIADGGAGAAPRDGARPLAVGTPAYMPPERARADQGDLTGSASDVFSLGAMLCEILTGEPPYRGSDRSEIFRRAVSADLDDALARLDACGADAALVSLARDSLAVKPDDRPADAEAVARRVADHVAAVGRRARDAELELARAHAKHLSERRARRLTLALAATVILGLVAGGTGFFLLDREKRTRQADSARLVDEALVEAHQALAEAQVAQPPDPERWAHAETAAVRAVTLAERQQADAAMLARAQALRDDTHRLREDRMRQVAFQERIEDIEHHGLEEDRASDWLDAAYRDAFRSAGLDPAALDAKLADENARTFLGLALSRWALARRRVPRSGDSARDLLEAAMRVDPDPDRRSLCAAFLAGDHDALLKAARAEGKLAESPESLVLLSRFLIDLGHAEEATAVLRVACERHPGDFRAHHDLAARLGAEKKPPYDEIIRLLSMCVAVRPSSAHALTDLGGAYHSNEMPDLAAEASRRATALQPSHPRGWVVLATILRDQGEVDLAREAARTGVGCETDPDGLSRFAVQFWKRGLVDVAEEAFRKAIAAKPEHLGARLDLGELELSRGAYEAALVHFRGAIETAPKLAGAWKGLGRALAGVMSWGDAADAFGRASELGDTSPDLPATLGRMLMLAGNTERGLEVLELAPGLDDRGLEDARRAAGLAKPERTCSRVNSSSSPSELPDRPMRRASRCSADGSRSARGSLTPGNGISTPRSRRALVARAAALAGRGLGLDAGRDFRGGRAPRSAASPSDWMKAELGGSAPRLGGRSPRRPATPRRGEGDQARIGAPVGAARRLRGAAGERARGVDVLLEGRRTASSRTSTRSCCRRAARSGWTCPRGSSGSRGRSRERSSPPTARRSTSSRTRDRRRAASTRCPSGATARARRSPDSVRRACTRPRRTPTAASLSRRTARSTGRPGASTSSASCRPAGSRAAFRSRRAESRPGEEGSRSSRGARRRACC